MLGLIVFQTITREKQHKLLGRMRIMGLLESVCLFEISNLFICIARLLNAVARAMQAYWTTWFGSYAMIALAGALLASKQALTQPRVH